MLITLVIWATIELRQSLVRHREATTQDSGSLVVLRLAALACAGLAALALKVSPLAFAPTTAAYVVSLGLIWSGVALRWWCFRTLGRYFTFAVMTDPEQPVVTSGPYSVVRHPGYSGILLILAGLGLGYGNWLSLAALTVVPFAGFVHRIRIEEAALTATLGARYTSYAHGRKRIVPLVW